MTVERPRPVDRSPRLWEWDPGLPPETDGGEGPIALVRQAGIIAWSHKFRLSTCLVAGLVCGALYADSLPRIYDAQATLLLEPRKLSQSLDLNSAESELQIILSERLLSQVFDSLDLAMDPELSAEDTGLIKSFVAATFGAFSAQFSAPAGQDGTVSDIASDTPPDVAASEEERRRRRAFAKFIDKVSARRVGQSYVVEIGYSSSNRELPARVANAVLSGYILQSVLAKEQLARAGTETLQGRLDALAAQVDAARDAMRAGGLPMVATPDADAKITGAALPPLTHSSPRTTLITAFGGMLGLFGSLAILAASITFNRRVYRARDLVRQTSMPCLATIPDPADKHGRLSDVDKPASRKYAMAVRNLRTAIDSECLRKVGDKVSDRHSVVALVGHSANVDSVTLAASLAELTRRGGRYVTLFRCRAPDDNKDGSTCKSLADAAIRSLDPALVQYEQRDGVSVLSIHSSDRQVNTFADFRSATVSRIIDEARRQGDVILELPPLSSSLDAVALAGHADAVVIVVRAGKTSTDEVRQSELQLRRAGARLIGYVLNRTRI